MEKKFTPQEWASAGRLINGKDKYDLFYPLDADGTADTSKRLAFISSGKGALTVGGVYLIEATAERDTARISGAKFVRMYEDKALIIEWRAAHDADRLAIAAAAAERRAKANNDALAALDPLRRLWRSSVGDQRLALEIVVLNYLRTGNR